MSSTIQDLRVKLEDPDARVNDAESRAASALRSRDRVLGLASYVEELHHSAGADLCTCGKKQIACSEYKAMYVMREAIAQWERRNKDRMRRGQAHDLPRDHTLAEPDRAPLWRGPQSLEDEYRQARRS
ncbi:hypothetical protein [Herbiconiux sp. A18JL235]|uniref:Uncharacterized protein n=1 Tax=Herbiconiux sp. A18JL235 TaxID=3152363 RepID=A0AB39BLX3_9MICO